MKRIELSKFFICALLTSSSAFADCLYCDEWRAFTGSTYFANSIIAITETSITLPSCSSSDYDIVQKAPSRQFGPICTEHYLRLKEKPSCKLISTTNLKPIAMVVSCPRQSPGNDELEVSLLQDSTVPVNVDSTFYGPSWRLIRKNYDPCDSGGGHGQWMCSLFALEVAEKKLKTLTHAGTATAQQRWIAIRNHQCKTKSDGFSESWAYQDEMNCKVQLTLKRISALRGRTKAAMSSNFSAHTNMQ